MTYSHYCPVCKSNNWRLDQFAGQIIGLPPEYDIFLCKNCGLRRLNPQLSENELASLYSDGYFNSANAGLTSESISMSSSDYISQVAPSRYAQFCRTIQSIKHQHPNAVNFLDVGAATGDMVKIALEQGLEADGIELSSFAVLKAKELYAIDLQQIRLAELPKTGYYDFIHLNHVFEHFNNPRIELYHLHRLLKREGGLFIEIPYQFHNLEKLLFKLKGCTAKFSVESLHHPYFYTPKTLRRILHEYGFEVIECSVFDPKRYPAGRFSEKIKKALWWCLSLCSIGNYVVIFARKRK